MEEHNYLPYFDIKIHLVNNSLKLGVHRKSTKKNNLINFYSHHKNKIKSGIVIGFYLRALRICSPHYLHEEKYIENTFNLLQYPNYFIFDGKQRPIKHSKTKRPLLKNPVKIYYPTN